MRFPLWLSGLALLGLASVFVSPVSAQELLWRADPSGRSVVLDPEEWRGRPVRAERVDWLAEGRRRPVRLELFDGERVDVELVRQPSASPGAAVWYGNVAGAGPDDHLILAWRQGAVAGTLTLGPRLLRLRGGPGAWTLAEADPELFDPCAGPLLPPAEEAPAESAPPPDEEAGEAAGGGQAAALALGAEGVLVVDVMTVWTPAARSAAGGTNAILALIDLAVAEANLSFANCDAGMFLRLVHAEEVQYTESGSMSTDLSRLRSKTDGHMDGVHALRDTYGADAVSLITNSGGACGQGYLMTWVSPNFESSAFNITRRSCAVGNYTYAHEFGHNFGCAHDPANAGSASHNYAYGYRTPNNLYRTVMAYSPGSRRPIFSSPLHFWNGYVMGTATQDNARALTTNAPTIANWRPTMVGGEDCDGNGIPDGVQLAEAGSDVDQNGVLDVCQSLAGDKLALSLVYGGTQALTLNAGPERAGHFYLLLGSLSGTTPTTPFLGLDLPLVSDPYLQLTLGLGAGDLFLGQVGVLNGEGRATSAFTIPSTPLLQLITTPANHAFVAFDANLTPSFVSTPFPVLFAFL